VFYLGLTSLWKFTPKCVSSQFTKLLQHQKARSSSDTVSRTTQCASQTVPTPGLPFARHNYLRWFAHWCFAGLVQKRPVFQKLVLCCACNWSMWFLQKVSNLRINGSDWLAACEVDSARASLAPPFLPRRQQPVPGDAGPAGQCPGHPSALPGGTASLAQAGAPRHRGPAAPQPLCGRTARPIWPSGSGHWRGAGWADLPPRGPSARCSSAGGRPLVKLPALPGRPEDVRCTPALSRWRKTSQGSCALPASSVPAQPGETVSTKGLLRRELKF